MTTIQLRIDENTKTEAQKMLEKIGLDLSSAIKIYLKQIVIKKGIPFPLLTENSLTEAQEEAILNASNEAKSGNHVTKSMNIKEAKKYLKNM